MIGPADVRPDTLLLLRQTGLRDDLIGTAAEAGHAGWWDPGIALFHDIGDRLGRTGLVPCGPFERLVLVERALHESGDFFSSLRRADAFVDAADRLFGEFLAEGIRPVDLEGALQRAAPRDGFQRDRDRALLRAFRNYTSALEQDGRRDGRDDVADCAAAVAADPEACRSQLGARSKLRIVGLHDLGGGWPRLLAALEAVPGLETVSVEGRAAAELDDTDFRGVSLSHPTDEPFDEPGAGPAPSPRVSVFSAYGPDREVEEVAVRVRALLDSGVAPDRACVVARSGRPYTELAVRALERLAVPVTARRRRRLEQIPVVRAVLSLYAAAADGWTRHALAELAEQPYIGSDLDAVVLNHIGYQRRVQGLSAWASALRRLLERADRAERAEAEAEAGDDPSAGGERRASVPPAAWVREAVEGFRAFADRAAELERPRPRGEWLDGLAEALAEDHWGMAERVYRVPDGQEELARWDIAGWEGLRRVVDELRAGEAAWGGAEEPLDAAAFHRFLRSMLRGDAAIRTPVRTGVRVLEAPAAAYRRFDHVFAVGLESGAWPLSPPASPLLEEGDRERLRAEGLPVRTRADWDRREEALYEVVAGGARETLTLSWSRVDDRGEPTVPSVFVEDATAVVAHLPTHRVLTPGVPLVADGAAARQAEHAARIERERASGAAGPWNGAIEDAEMRAWLAARYDANYVWSATSLEGVAKCPWAWFGGRLLRLEKREDPDADLDPIARGNLYHDALRRFYRAAGERVAGPVRLTEDDLGWARELAAEATRAAIAEASPRDAAALRAVPAPLRDVKAAELERTVIRFLEWEAQLATQGETPRFRSKYPQLRTGVVDHELSFDDLEIPIGEEVLRLRGTIDRVEVGVDPRVPDADRYAAAVDYKSTQYSMPAAGRSAGWDDGVVQQLPLYAAALSRLDPDREVARLEYRAVRTRAVGHVLPLVAVAKGDAGPQRDADAAARQEAALRAALSSALRVRDGEFPARPAPSCGCPPYCHGWDICRVPGGPRR